MSIQSMNQCLLSLFHQLILHLEEEEEGVRTWIEGCCKWPTFEVDWRGSNPIMICWGLIERNASITTLPLTDWIGSTTTATARGLSCSKDYLIEWEFERGREGGRGKKKRRSVRVRDTTNEREMESSGSRTCWVFTSTEESQHPNPGWEWYQPTTISGLHSPS